MNRTARLPILRSLLLGLNALALGTLASAQTAPASKATASTTPASTVTVPREKISLECSDSFYKTTRSNFILQDEVYPKCTLILPLALSQRWPGQRTFYIIPRVSANLFAKDDRGNGRWLPLSPLVTPGEDALHTTLSSDSYRAVELVGKFAKLSEVAGTRTPDTVGAGGKITVCVAPIRSGEAPCMTFDVTARFRVYRR
jgi:hypothetical protein